MGNRGHTLILSRVAHVRFPRAPVKGEEEDPRSLWCSLPLVIWLLFRWSRRLGVSVGNRYLLPRGNGTVKAPERLMCFQASRPIGVIDVVLQHIVTFEPRIDRVVKRRFRAWKNPWLPLPGQARNHRHHRNPNR